MYLLLAAFWLLCGIGLLAYETAVGTGGRIGPVVVGLCFVWALYNVGRWYSRRSGKNDEEALRIVEEARRRQNRQRHREPDYDPNLDFTKQDDRPPG